MGKTSYMNVYDGVCRIYQAKLPPDTKLKLFFRLRRFYAGFHLFGLTQILFIAFEFSFYES